MCRAPIAPLTLLILSAGVASSYADEPRRTDLVEETEARLAQVQISVSGPPHIIGSLSAEDFAIKVNLTKIHDFELDRFCRTPGAGDESAAADAPEPYGPASFLLYFDQPLLTMAGRARALDVSHRLVDELIRDGAQAIVVSNAGRLAVVQELTGDPAALHEALRRLENDRAQWDFYAEQESSRVGEIVELLNQDTDVHRAISAARAYQRVERFLVDKSLRRLEVTIGRLSELQPPKFVLYFADTMRSNAGEHYLTFFGTRLRQQTPALTGIETDSQVGGLPFDRVVNEASALGIRFYTVLAQGLVTPVDHTPTTPEAMMQTKAVPDSARIRFRDSQDSLGSLASETGGHSFTRGESARRILAQVRGDLSCVYVASFDPEGFATDAPLRISVKPRRPGITLSTRGRIVFQSRRARLASRLLSAFTLNHEDELDLDLRTQLIPTGYDGRRYQALLQICVPATSLPSATWDLGASLIQRERVSEEVSGRIAVARPDVITVLEQEVELRPGPGEIVAVAHDAASDFVLSDHIRIDWPEPELDRAICEPIVLVQPTNGAFVRDGRTRTTGSLAQPDGHPIDATRPAALLSLVCRGSRENGDVRVERNLIGSSAVSFPVLDFDLGSDRCAQVRDVIPAGVLAPGSYSYEVQVRRRDSLLDRAERSFRVAVPAP